MDRAISDYGTRVLRAVDNTYQPVLWRLIKKDKHEPAAELLQFAKDNQILVTFRSGNDDLLSWAIENKPVDSVRFIVDKLVEGCTSLEETCYLLNLHFHKLVRQFPDLMWDYLHKDKFTFEYARFSIPKLPYRIKSGYLAGLFTDYRLKDWNTANHDEAKMFWSPSFEGRRGRRSYGMLAGSTSLADMRSMDTQIAAVAKFFCISYGGSQTVPG